MFTKYAKQLFAGVTASKGSEKATIDCSMIILEPYDSSGSIKAVGTDVSTQIEVEAQTEKTDAVKLMVKGVLKAQKPEKVTITGHTITLTNSLTIMEFLPMLQGGEIIKDPQGKITGYKPPVAGTKYDPAKFKLHAYSAVMEGSDIVGYEHITYPKCIGQPVTFGAQDDTFRVDSYTINSAPGAGERPYELEYVDSLPTLTETVSGS